MSGGRKPWGSWATKQLREYHKGRTLSITLEGRCEIDCAVTDIAVETWSEMDAGRRLESAEK